MGIKRVRAEVFSLLFGHRRLVPWLSISSGSTSSISLKGGSLQDYTCAVTR